MHQHLKAAIIAACAVALATGAYFILSGPKADGPVVRQEIAPPEENATAPAWVSTGQKPEPDYSSGSLQAHNATPAPEPEPTMEGTISPGPIEVREDPTVTLTFVESLTDALLDGFRPVGSRGTPVSTTSIKSLNMYFGREMRGLPAAGDDVRAARKAVLDSVFTPERITALHALYAPVLVADLADSALTEARSYTVGDAVEERTLTPAETATMLRLVARDAERAGASLRAVGNDPAVIELAGKYLGAARAVERANARLQAAVDGGDDTATAGQRLKQAILQREQIRASVIASMREACPDCPDSELFYLAQWAYRRTLDQPQKRLPAFVAAADALDDLARRLRARSSELE